MKITKLGIVWLYYRYLSIIRLLIIAFPLLPVTINNDNNNKNISTIRYHKIIIDLRHFSLLYTYIIYTVMVPYRYL